MAKSSADHDQNPHGSPSTNDQPIERINGISDVRGKLLRRLKIRTVGDLAKASAADLSPRLTQLGQTISPGTIQAWIDQATELISQTASPASDEGPSLSQTRDSEPQHASSETASPEPDNSPEGSSPPPEQGQAIQATTGHPEAQPPPSTSTDWQSVATFSIRYQTRKTDDQVEHRIQVTQPNSNIEPKIWAGFQTEEIAKWLATQVKAFPGQTAPVPPTTHSEEPIRIQVVELWIEQTNGAEAMPRSLTPGQMLPGWLTTGEYFTLGMALQLSPQEPAIFHNQAPTGRVRCFAHRRTGGSPVALGTAEFHILNTASASYTVELTDMQFSETGVFKLELEISLRHPQVYPTVFEIPIVRVMATT